METYPDLLQSLHFLKFPDEKQLLYFSDSDSNSDSVIEQILVKPKQISIKSEQISVKPKQISESSDLFLSCTFTDNIENKKDVVFNDIFTETLSEKYKSPKKRSKKSKKTLSKSKKSLSKSKKTLSKSKKTLSKSKERSKK
jgi:hypothetical protein